MIHLWKNKNSSTVPFTDQMNVPGLQELVWEESDPLKGQSCICVDVGVDELEDFLRIFSHRFSRIQSHFTHMSFEGTITDIEDMCQVGVYRDGQDSFLLMGIPSQETGQSISITAQNPKTMLRIFQRTIDEEISPEEYQIENGTLLEEVKNNFRSRDLKMLTMSFVIITVSFVVNAYVLSVLWQWFVVPMGVPSISVAQAFGVFLIIRWSTRKQLPTPEDKRKVVLRQMLLHLGSAGICLLVGWIATCFM